MVRGVGNVPAAAGLFAELKKVYLQVMHLVLTL